MQKKYDVIIIGGGPAGLSAAMWLAELGLRAILLEASGELGGQLLWTFNSIKNYPGVEAENGRELQEIFAQQLKNREFDLRKNCAVVAVDVANRRVTLKSGETLTADSLIFATGVRRRKFGFENEEKFQGKGILTSGKLDAEKVAGKRVAVVGGGDAALENALILAEFADQVTLIHRRPEFRARPEFVEKVQANKKIKILSETVVTKIDGYESLQALKLQNLKTNKIDTYSTDFLLLRLGVQPNTELVRGQVNVDELGYCLIDSACQTNLDDIYAIGDVANPQAPTISGAVGMGATVAKIIYSRLKHP